jgi:tRNA1(Val) A37 N6-methylase TrmN6
MITLDPQIERLRQRFAEGHDSVSRLIVHLADQVRVSQGGGSDEMTKITYVAFRQMQVLELLHQNLHSHPELPRVTLDCYAELPTLEVLRGVFSPEFATDSYLWARFIAGQRLVDSKAMLEMGAGSGLISLYLNQFASPQSTCAVDVNPFAVANLRANLHRSGLNQGQFAVIESDLYARVPEQMKFDVAFWAMPWVFADDPFVCRVVAETEDPVQYALLRSAVDPGGRTIMKFITDSKRHLNPGGKVLLISSDFIPNERIREHALSEGFEWSEVVFAEQVTVVESSGMTLDLHHLELTLA